jgi:hypothetical protein
MLTPGEERFRQLGDGLLLIPLGTEFGIEAELGHDAT